MSNMEKKFEADTGKILDIVINSLYSEREIFLNWDFFRFKKGPPDAVRVMLLTKSKSSPTFYDFCNSVYMD